MWFTDLATTIVDLNNFFFLFGGGGGGVPLNRKASFMLSCLLQKLYFSHKA